MIVKAKQSLKQRFLFWYQENLQIFRTMILPALNGESQPVMVKAKYISECSFQNVLHCDCVVSCITLAERDSVHCHFADAMEVNERCDDHQDVKDLMWLALKMLFRWSVEIKCLWTQSPRFTHPEIKLAREPSLGDSQSVEHCAQNVEKSHQHQPSKWSAANAVEPAFHPHVMNRWNHAWQAKCHEHSRSHRSQLGSWELVPKRRHDGEEAEHGDDSQVDDLRLLVTVKAVVEPRDKGTWNERNF